MSIPRKALSVIYAALALLAAIGTWGHIPGPLTEDGLWRGFVRFWQDVLVNDSSSFITIDILFLIMAIVPWMLMEARRLRIPYVWLYVAFGIVVTISIAMPVFMLHRERRLAALEADAPAGTLKVSDLIGMSLIAVTFLAFTIHSHFR